MLEGLYQVPDISAFEARLEIADGPFRAAIDSVRGTSLKTRLEPEFICERCIDLADEVVAEGEARANRWTRLASEREPEARCNFCGKRRQDVTGMVVAPDRRAIGKFGRKRLARRFPGVRECSECLDLCHEIMAEQHASGHRCVSRG